MIQIEQRELEIGSRICEWREDLNWSQAALAHSVRPLALTKNQLANIESGRTPLRYDLGDRFCSFFGLSQRWLALGTEPMTPYVPLPDSIRDTADGFRDSPFSLNYQAFLAAHCDAFFALQLDSVTASLKSLSVLAPAEKEAEKTGEQARLKVSVLNLVAYAVRVVPPRFYSGLVQAIGAACSDLIAKEATIIKKFIESGETPAPVVTTRELPQLLATADVVKMNRLTSDTVTVIVPSTMNKPITSWPELRERLIALTSERGAKAALARRFNVTPQAVGEWTRGKSMPSADTTIRLLPWVAEQECKLKAVTAARNKPSSKRR